MIESSYSKNNFGKILKAYVESFLPRICVELGVLNGYSTSHIALGIREIKKWNNVKSILHAYDLFEDYPYKHSKMSDVKRYLEEQGLDQYVRLIREDAFKAHEAYTDRSVDFLHVDLSNTGDTIKTIMESWHEKISGIGIICFEGGSEERDKVDWMVKYEKPSIRREILCNSTINKYYSFKTYEEYPSMTVLKRL